MIHFVNQSQQKDIYLPEPATLIRAHPLTELERFFEFRLDSGKELGHMPGQFVQVSLAGMGEAPISISSSPTDQGSFQLVVRKVGNVTSALHRLQPGQQIGVRGPLGTHFPVESVMKGKDLLFVCGGLGLVPVRSAINYIFNHRRDYGHVAILYGAKTPSDRLFVDEIQRWKEQVDVEYWETVDCADKEWQGNVGVITTLIHKPKLCLNRTVAVVCGPPIMYKFVIIELHKLSIKPGDVYLSLERHMKCGVGKCGHCQINGLYVCQDGPVVRYVDLAHAREAI